MPHIRTSDGVQLYYEETGRGDPLLFLHEFGGHYMSWEPQVRYFSRRYRCIAYAARGWPPSDVPDDVSMYSQARAADDAMDVIKALSSERPHTRSACRWVPRARSNSPSAIPARRARW